MIAEAIRFLRDRLNKSLPQDSSDGAAEELFVFVGSNKDDSVSFKSDAVSVLLVRIEEESLLLQPDRYRQTSAEGLHKNVSPEIRMHLWVLFVARFPDDYSRALQRLSDVISYFQNHRVFNQENSPELSDDVSKLVLELVTPTFAEQNEIWGSLRVAYQPSALYKVKMVVFRDEDGEPLTSVDEVILTHDQVQSQ